MWLLMQTAYSYLFSFLIRELFEYAIELDDEPIVLHRVAGLNLHDSARVQLQVYAVLGLVVEVDHEASDRVKMDSILHVFEFFDEHNGKVGDHKHAFNQATFLNATEVNSEVDHFL